MDNWRVWREGENLGQYMDRIQRVAQLERMIAVRLEKEWVDHALRSDEPERWRLAFAEMLSLPLPSRKPDATTQVVGAGDATTETAAELLPDQPKET